MGLVDIVKEIGQERRNFTSAFRDFVHNRILENGVSESTQSCIKAMLEDEGVTRYYRYSVTASQVLQGFGLEVSPKGMTEMKKSIGLMLFWLRFADRYMDSQENPSKTIEQVNNHIEFGYELPQAQDSLTDSLYFSAGLLRKHGLNEGYLESLINPLRKMTESMMIECPDIKNVRLYCDRREDTGITLTKTLLAIMKVYTSNRDTLAFQRMEKFFQAQFRAGMHFDSLADFNKDYIAGIAPEPSIQNKAYVCWRMARGIADHFLQLPGNMHGITRVLAYSAVSTYQIFKDSATQG